MIRMTWEEMVQNYPDQWVAVKDAEMDGAAIVSGEIVTHLPDDEIIKYRMKNHGKGIVCRRTTESTYNAGLFGVI